MSTGVYFNEHDPFAAQWLRNLYPKATVDQRDIQQVTAADVAGFRRCHFFGGIGGWQEALGLAGWGDAAVWTGSCPCQPLSCAGQRAGEKDERHLWPEFYRLIDEHRPTAIFGEQVASTDGLEWLDGISLDLEELDYIVGASDLPAASKGAPMPRQRFWWGAVRKLGNADGPRLGARWWTQRSERSQAIEPVPATRIASSRLGGTNGAGPQPRRAATTTNGHGGAAIAASCVSGMGLAIGDGQRGERTKDGRTTEAPWTSSVVWCRDDKWRRVAIEPSSFPLAYGIPTRNNDPRMGSCIAELERMGHSTKSAKQLLRSARRNRVGRLRGYGNAICPQVAAVFIRAFMDATHPTET